MKSWKLPVVLAFALVSGPGALRADSPLFAQQWPLALERDSGAVYQVEIDESVYRTAIDPLLRDVAVLDAESRQQPAAVLRAPPIVDAEERRVALPWFPAPPESGGPSPRWRIITEAGADARLRRVETELLDPRAAPPRLTDVLVDASQLDAAVMSLELAWGEPAMPVDTRYVLEYSDDLEHWRSANTGARILDLTNAGHHVVRNRIEVNAGGTARYFRLRRAPGQRGPAIHGVDAILAPPSQLPPMQWIELNGEVVDEGGARAVHYRNPGRFPVTAVQPLPALNSSQRWQLESRADASSRWQRQGPPAVAYRLADGDGESLSPPLVLSAASRDREWRLLSREPVHEPPVLRLGYHPESLVFLARGTPPFTLVAGSAIEHREDAPIGSVITAQRAERGPQWVPAQATTGPGQPLAGDAALVARPRRHFGHWLMWGMLMAGSALVVVLALQLLRRSEA